MSTDTGVSDLIRQFQTRRLDTDPGDAFLFQQSAQPQHTETVRAAGTLPPPSRSFDRAPGRLFDRAPAHSLDRSAGLPLDRALDSLDHASLDRAPKGRASRSIAPPLSLGRIPRATAPTHPTAPRDVVWPWIAATILAGMLGVIGAEYLWRSLGDEAAPARDPEIAASVAPSAAPPAADSTAVAPHATSAPLPSPASDSTPAAPHATDTPSPATGATAVDAIVPPVSSPIADPAPTSTPHKTAHRRGRARAKTQRVTAKHAKAPAQALTPVAAKPSPPSQPARPATQSSDREDPL